MIAPTTNQVNGSETKHEIQHTMNSATPTETEETKLFLKWISRYLIALSGTCKLPSGEEGKFNYSACVVSYRGKDYVLTVGHAFTDLENEVFKLGGTITGAVLADYFGIVPKSNESFPFNIYDYPHTRVNDASFGLDYALIELSQMHVGFLKANAIESIPLEGSSPSPTSAPDSYIVIGFPEERVRCVMQPQSPLVEMEVEPNGLKLKRLSDDSSKVTPRFVGEILDLGDLKSTKGFSGGPILAIVNRQDSPADCHVLGIQESWNQVDTVYGCLLDRIFEHAKPWLDARAVDNSKVS